MAFKSDPFYFKVKGRYALFTDPYSKGGGEKVSYQVPTRQALQGIADAAYYKPTIENVIDEVKIMNEIKTETKGVRTLVKNGKSADLNYVSYLKDVEYLVKYHFVWNENRPDLKKDRNEYKHQAITVRSLKRGGRRDIFLGARECTANLEYINARQYKKAKGYYYDNKNPKISFGIMFDSFIYPAKSGEPLISCFKPVQMINGIIKFTDKEDCPIKKELSNYEYSFTSEIKSVAEEYEEIEE